MRRKEIERKKIMRKEFFLMCLVEEKMKLIVVLNYKKRK